MPATRPTWAPLTGATRAIALEVLLHGPLPRSELARRLRLSPGSVTRLATPLLECGLLVEAGTQREARSGRPTRPLDVVPEAHHFIGVKITGEEAHAALTTLRAEVVATTRSTLDGKAPEAVVATVRRLATELARGVPHVTALGVSIGGTAPDHATVTAAPFLGWTGDVPFGRLLAAATGLPTVVDNDLLALTRGEHWFGAARGHDRFALLTIGDGVGYGLVMHGEVVDSPEAGVGLAGHLPLDPLGPPCPDGHRGCATAMLTGPSIRAWVSTGLQREVTYDECLDLAAAGNPVAEAVITDAGRALGRLIAVVANLTMSQKIILTGEGVRLAEVARDAVEEGIRRDRDPRCRPLSLDVVPVDFTQWARGAAATAIQNYLLNGHASMP
ncbi:MAG TPA: ROK family transcriptional regulator [Pseudonocardiaceae bacterium]